MSDPNPKRKILLIGWDAADWKIINPLLEQGRMPNLAGLIERGVMGNLATLQPVLSPMLWTSIATGKRPFKHGILGFTEPTPDGGAVQPVSQLSRTTKAIWNILNQEGYVSSVVGWWPSHPVESINGVMVSNHYHHAVGPPEQPWPLPPGVLHPQRLRETLAELRFNPNELTAEEVLPFVPLAAAIDQNKDRRLGSVMKILAECVSVHNAATWLMANEPWDFFAVYYDAIDHFCHGFMRYHPPRLEWIPERDFELYSGVVNAGYQFHDLMLGAKLRLVDENTTIILCSDHGFHPDHLRPRQIPREPAGPAVEHRDLGILVIAGPGIKRDELIHGATLLDITPTILTLCGLPVGEDMDGKPLLQAFETPPAVQRIPSWDEVPGDDGRHAESLRFDPLAAKAALEQLVALGYVEAPGPDAGQAVERTAREMRYNLARAYMNADLYRKAIPILQELQENDPEESRFGVQLAMCYRTTREIPALRTLVEQLRETRAITAEKAVEQIETLRQTVKERRQARAAEREVHADEAAAPENKGSPLLSREERQALQRWRSQRHTGGYDLDFLMSCVLLDEGCYEEALEYLAKAEQAEPQRPGLHIQIGETYLRMKQWQKADEAFSKALTIDPLNVHAHLGLARAHHARRRFDAAAREALETVRLMFHYPLAHFVLGRALFRLHRFEAAERSLTVATDLNPNFVQAHRMLLWIYRVWIRNQPEAQTQHRAMLAQLRRQRRQREDPSLAAARDEFAEAPSGELVPVVTTIALPKPVEADQLFTSGRNRWPDEQAPMDFVTVVAGLPRSGTSMLMQMLDAGGMEILTDRKRKADEDNPKGYYELEQATQLRKKREWVGEARHKAVKIVAQLAPYLPLNIPYRVIFIERDLAEVTASQKTMLKRLNRTSAKFTDGQIQAAYRRQLAVVKDGLARNPNAWVLYVQHHQVIEQPEMMARKISQFLGEKLDSQAMAAAVDPMLYRQKLANLSS
ncbi:MAG: alkaline phosphatase family protein [Candidatus Contendobacter sp.]|nr:alkaline phosphatase family protein [Candidatus Contendobacter sp.]